MKTVGEAVKVIKPTAAEKIDIRCGMADKATINPQNCKTMEPTFLMDFAIFGSAFHLSIINQLAPRNLRFNSFMQPLIL